MMGRKVKEIINGKLRCSNCKRAFTINNFFKKNNPKCKNGYESFCKKCFNFSKSKKRKGGTISNKDFGTWIVNQDKKCFYCGITPEEIKKLKNTHIFWGNCDSLTIDRMNNSKGYDHGNIVLCCMRCNRIKSNIFTFKEMIIIGKILSKKKPLVP